MKSAILVDTVYLAYLEHLAEEERIMELTAEKLREFLHYDEATGVFTWAASRGGRRAGMVAGHQDKRGYITIRVNDRLYLAHRMAWLWATEEWPTGEIDHRNSKRSDNRFDNLRDVNHAINQQNLKTPQRNNNSGFLGVSKKRDKWRARIQSGDRQVSLGSFKTPEEAYKAYINAKRVLHVGCMI